MHNPIPGATLAVALTAGSGLAQESVPRFHLVLSDGNRQLYGQAGRVAEQIVSIFQNLGIRVSWSSDPSVAAGDLRTVIVIVLPHSSRKYRLAPGVLGSVRRESDLRSSVFLFYPDVERALNIRPARTTSILASDTPSALWQLGVARVAAHEVLHYFLPGRPHDETGLFSENLSGRNLLSAEIEVAEATRDALIENLSR